MTASDNLEQRRKNLRTGLILGSVAAVFFVGYILRNWILGA